MRTKSPKWILIVSLSTLLYALGCNFVNVGPGVRVMPIRSLTLTIEKSQREELFDQLRKFADKHGFEHRVTDFNTNGEHFQFWMSGDDMFITASDVPPDPDLVDISLYGKNPGVSVDEEVVDDLVNDLKSFISEIPNATIVEQ